MKIRTLLAGLIALWISVSAQATLTTPRVTGMTDQAK